MSSPTLYRFPARIGSVRPMLACLERHAGRAGAERVARAQVTVEELVVNAVTYGGVPADPWAEITLSIVIDAQGLEIVLRDPFRAYDPFAAIETVRTLAAAGATASARVGLGRLLAADLPSQRSWRRDGMANEVRMLFS